MCCNGRRTSRRPVGFQLDLIRRTPTTRIRHDCGSPLPARAGQLGGEPVKAGTTLAVLHGSNLGTCRALAKQLAEEATDNGCVRQRCAAGRAAGGLPEADAVLIVASSYNGQPTDDARAFLTWLQPE